MKTTLVLIFFLFSISLHSQITSGGGGRVENPRATNEIAAKDFIKNRGYFRIGLASPKGTFGAAPTPSNDISEPYRGTNNMGVSPGLAGEIGALLYFDLPIQEQFKAGIDWSIVDGSFHSFDWLSGGEYYEEANEYFSTLVLLSTKLGPVFSFSPIADLVFDTYFKFSPTFIFNDEAYVGSYYSDHYVMPQSEVNFFLRKTFGLNFRFKALIVGWNLDWGTVTSNYVHEYTSINHTTGFYSNEKDTFKANYPVKTSRFSIGVNF